MTFDALLRQRHITSMAYPASVTAFIQELRKELGAAVAIETEETRTGNWWLDLRTKRHLAVEWRPKQGFGFSQSSKPAFGERPSEVFVSPQRAAQRVAQLLTQAERAVRTDLSALRQLYGMTQSQLGKKVRVGQSAIARVERGRDSKIETLRAYVEGLGGTLEVTAVFPDGHLPVPLPEPRTRSHASTKSARLARA